MNYLEAIDCIKKDKSLSYVSLYLNPEFSELEVYVITCNDKFKAEDKKTAKGQPSKESIHVYYESGELFATEGEQFFFPNIEEAVDEIKDLKFKKHHLDYINSGYMADSVAFKFFPSLPNPLEIKSPEMIQKFIDSLTKCIKEFHKAD